MAEINNKGYDDDVNNISILEFKQWPMKTKTNYESKLFRITAL